MRKNNNNNIIAIEKKKKLNDSHNKLNSIDYFEHMYSGNLLENVIWYQYKIRTNVFIHVFFSVFCHLKNIRVGSCAVLVLFFL